MTVKSLRELGIILEYNVKDRHLTKLINHVLRRVSSKFEEAYVGNSERSSFDIWKGRDKNGAYCHPDYILFDPERLDEIFGDDKGKIGVIAHEFAHMFLDHPNAPDDGRGRISYEEEANKLAAEWGFSKEIEAALKKWSDHQVQSSRKQEPS